VLLMLILIVPMACDYGGDEDALPFAPSGCEINKPNTGLFELVVTINKEFPRVPVAIYEGDFENNIIVTEDTLTRVSAVYQLLTEKNYSAVAIYVIGPDTVAVLDSDTIDPVSTEYRDGTCWDVQNGVADLQLRVRP